MCPCRRRSIELPITVPRSMFERELDYYGIPTVETSIAGPRSLPELAKSFSKMKLEHDMFFLAAECFHQFWRDGLKHSPQDRAEVTISKDHALHGGTVDTKMFYTYLERHFGLVVTTSSDRFDAAAPLPNRTGQIFYVCLAK